MDYLSTVTTSRLPKIDVDVHKWRYGRCILCNFENWKSGNLCFWKWYLMSILARPDSCFIGNSNFSQILSDSMESQTSRNGHLHSIFLFAVLISLNLYRFRCLHTMVTFSRISDDETTKPDVPFWRAASILCGQCINFFLRFTFSFEYLNSSTPFRVTLPCGTCVRGCDCGRARYRGRIMFSEATLPGKNTVTPGRPVLLDHSLSPSMGYGVRSTHVSTSLTKSRMGLVVT